MADEQKYVVIDVEAIEPNVWLSIGILQAIYPSGAIVSMKEFFVDRTEMARHIAHEPTAAFWQTHDMALQYNLSNGHGVQEDDAEQNICRYINQLRQHNPHFFMVSDNPAFDIRILDNILAKHGHAPLSDRKRDMFAQVLCTWSFRQSLAQTVGIKSPKLFTHPNICRLLGCVGTSYVTSRAVEKAAKRKGALPHTPIRDCANTLSIYFKCLDVAHALSDVLRKTFANNAFSQQHQQQQQLHLQQSPYQMLPPQPHLMPVAIPSPIQPQNIYFSQPSSSPYVSSPNVYVQAPTVHVRVSAQPLPDTFEFYPASSAQEQQYYG